MDEGHENMHMERGIATPSSEEPKEHDSVMSLPSPTPSPEPGEKRIDSDKLAEENSRRHYSGHLEDKPTYSKLYKYSPLKNWSLPTKVRSPYIITLISSMGGLLFGFAGSNLTPFIGNTQYNNYYHTPGAVSQGGISSAFPGGGFIGSMISSFISDDLGRRVMIQLVAIIWLIGSAIQCAAINRASLVWGRIIMGVAIGMASSNVPVYLQELSPPNIRGRLSSCFQLSQCIGILVMYFIAYGCSKVNDKDPHSVTGMRLAWGLEMIPGGIYLLGSLFLTESPRWLANMGEWTKCAQTLSFLRGKDIESPEVQEELADYEAAVAHEVVHKATIFDLFKGVSFGRTVNVLCAMMYQQVVGTNIVLFYATPIFDSAGHHKDLFRFTTILYAINVGMTIPAVLFIDRWSRRWVFIIGAAGMMSCMAILAGIIGGLGVDVPKGEVVFDDPTIRRYLPPGQIPAGKAAIAFTMIFFGTFAISWGPVGWTYMSEIFPMNQRGIGNGLASGVNWLFNFAITISCTPGFKNITYKMFVIYAVLGFVAIIHVFLAFPETCGYSLEEMDTVFESRVWAFKTDPVYLWFMKRRGKSADSVQLAQ